MKSLILSVALVVLAYSGAVLFPVDATPTTLAADLSHSTHGSGEGEWRRTAHGWELSTYWHAAPQTNASRDWEAWAAIHPVLVAAFLLLVSLAALQATTPVAASTIAVERPSRVVSQRNRAKDRPRATLSVCSLS